MKTFDLQKYTELVTITKNRLKYKVVKDSSNIHFLLIVSDIVCD